MNLELERSIQKWQDALTHYRYPVDLNTFGDRQGYGGWFTRNLDIGDREQTIEFETVFRKNAPFHLEAWFEVVYWKLYGVRMFRGAEHIINGLKNSGVSAPELWTECGTFAAQPSKRRFTDFQRLLVSGRNIAVCATFPAFVSPDRFPMVDKQITMWALKNFDEHNQSSQCGVLLAPPQSFDLRRGLLNISHYPFVESWIAWCQSKAKRLTELSRQQWRTRDVEMAVFTAERLGLRLPPIP